MEITEIYMQLLKSASSQASKDLLARTELLTLTSASCDYYIQVGASSSSSSSSRQQDVDGMAPCGFGFMSEVGRLSPNEL